MMYRRGPYNWVVRKIPTKNINWKLKNSYPKSHSMDIIWVKYNMWILEVVQLFLRSRARIRCETASQTVGRTGISGGSRRHFVGEGLPSLSRCLIHVFRPHFNFLPSTFPRPRPFHPLLDIARSPSWHLYWTTLTSPIQTSSSYSFSPPSLPLVPLCLKSSWKMRGGPWTTHRVGAKPGQ